MEESFQSGSQPQNRRMDREEFGGNRFEIHHRPRLTFIDVIRSANFNVPTCSAIAIVKSNCSVISSLNEKKILNLNYIKGKGNCYFTLIAIKFKAF